jgi:hypothetical protein
MANLKKISIIFEGLPQGHNSWRLVYKLENILYRWGHNQTSQKPCQAIEKLSILLKHIYVMTL